MPVISGYRVLVYEEYEKPDGVVGLMMRQPPAPRKLYDAKVDKIDLAKLVALVEPVENQDE